MSKNVVLSIQSNVWWGILKDVPNRQVLEQNTGGFWFLKTVLRQLQDELSVNDRKYIV